MGIDPSLDTKTQVCSSKVSSVHELTEGLFFFFFFNVFGPASVFVCFTNKRICVGSPLPPESAAFVSSIPHS